MRQFVIDHEEHWGRSRTQIESWVRRGIAPVREVDFLVPRADSPSIDALSGDQLLLAQKLLSELHQPEMGTQGGTRILGLYRSQDAREVEVAEAVLWELVGREDAAVAARAVARLGTRPNARLKSFAINLLTEGGRDERIVREAIAALAKQQLSDEEVQTLFELAKGLDRRILEDSITRSTRLETALLTSLASNRKSDIFPALKQYLDSPNVTPGLHIQGILSAVDAPESRRMLLDRLTRADLAANRSLVPLISALGSSIARGIDSNDPADPVIRRDYIVFMEAAIESEKTHPEIKEAAFYSIAQLIMVGAGDSESRLRAILETHKDTWKSSRRSEMIQRALNP